MRLHHVQVCCPPGGEADARLFYAEGLGLAEVEKPPALRSREGAWFRSYDADGVVLAEIHVGVESSCAPSRQAHPALVVDDVSALETVAARLRRLGFAVDWTERTTFDGWQRFHVADAAGNRVEVMA